MANAHDLRSTLNGHLQPLYVEVHRLALNSWALMTKIRAVSWANAQFSEESRLAETTALEALRREVILGLCRLDEADSTDWSFHTAKTVVSKSGFQKDFVDGLNRQVKDFRQNINHFKQEHRNAYIAHQTKNKFRNQFGNVITEFSPRLRKCVLSAFEIADYLFGERIEYGWWKAETPDAMINLRSLLEQ